MAERYLVTGGAGFIGSHLVERLLEDGQRVRILDDFSTGHRENIEPLARRFGDALEVLEGDVAVMEDCHRATAGIRYVFHEAALASVPRSLEDPVASHRVNATGTLNILMASRKAGVQRVIYAGSSSIYGDSKSLPKDETMTPHPLSPYALTKLVGEEYLRLFHLHFSMETVTLRYFNVFGSRQDPDSPYAAVIPLFISCLLRGEQPTIYGDGLQSRDFTHVANVVDANLAACHADNASGVYNVACGERTTLLELLDRVQQVLGTHIPPKHESPRPGDIRHSEADISRARKELGFEPRISFADGVPSTVDYFRGRG
ncbi:MAG: SDR family oxidoreductase [Candidatus Eisenbacteria sp.]|nr:SDR family oxidoreductase [Candidatus Eisenbacteria bacterium]